MACVVGSDSSSLVIEKKREEKDVKTKRWQSRKCLESTSVPRQQLYWQKLSDVTILKLYRVAVLNSCTPNRRPEW